MVTRVLQSNTGWKTARWKTWNDTLFPHVCHVLLGESGWQTGILNCSFTAALMLFSNHQTNMQERSASIRSDITQSCSSSTAPHSVLFTRQDGEIVGWVGGENGVSMKTSKLWVTSTHYPSTACSCFLGIQFKNCTHLFWTQVLSFCASLDLQPFNLGSPDWSTLWPLRLLFNFIYCSKPQGH